MAGLKHIVAAWQRSCDRAGEPEVPSMPSFAERRQGLLMDVERARLAGQGYAQWCGWRRLWCLDDDTERYGRTLQIGVPSGGTENGDLPLPVVTDNALDNIY